jgi:hypothetical protein
VTSLDKIQEQLDLLLAAKDDTVRFRELLLARLDDCATTGDFQTIAAMLEAQNTKLAAIFTRLCAQQEASRGKRAKRGRHG